MEPMEPTAVPIVEEYPSIETPGQDVVVNEQAPQQLGQQEHEMLMNNGEFQEIRTFLNDHIRHLMTTCVQFDTHEQLLWAGTQSGHITSYYSPSCMKYTAFQAHHSEVRKILPDAHGVLSLSANQVRYTTKQGLKIFSTSTEEMHSLHTLLRGTGMRENYVLMAGDTEHFFELDLTSGEVYQLPDVLTEPSTVVMKQSSHYLCCGHQHGKVTLHDPDSFEPMHSLPAHSAALSDFDIHGNLLVTTGFSTRYGHLTVDPYLMVYDLRTLRAFPPVQVPIEPFFTRFLPSYTVRCVVVSQSGQFVLCQPDSLVVDPAIYQLNNQGAAIMDFCLSDSYQGFAFGDAAGCVHLWSDREESLLLYNHNEQESVFANQTETLDAFDIDDWSFPLPNIHMPETKEPLLSDWPERLVKRADRPTPPIDPEILQNITIRQFVGYAPNPKKKYRNQVEYRLDVQDRDGYHYPESPMNREAGSIVPKIYRRVDIKYSKYGVESFDFKHYNQTKFSGLEIHIPNAYCNCMLQVYFVPKIGRKHCKMDVNLIVQMFYLIDAARVGLLNHVCDNEHCFACEMCCLFNMLDDSEPGQTCQATNLLRVFRTLPEASALGLLISDYNDTITKNRNLASTIQKWLRFSLRQMHQDTKAISEDDKEKSKPSTEDDKGSKVDDEKKPEQGNNSSAKSENKSGGSDMKEESDNGKLNDSKVSDFENESIIKELFGMDIVSCRTCKCGTKHERKSTLFSFDLTYPDKQEEEEMESYPFSKLLQDSLMRKQNTQAWCEKCKKYQSCKQVRKIKSLPDIISLSCHVTNQREIDFWKKQQDIIQPKISSTPKTSIHSSPPKLCRYGKFCNRKGCKFIHQGREGEPMKTPNGGDSDPTFNLSIPTWLPPYILVKHNTGNEEIEINEYVPDDELDKPDGIIYKLTSNVCHIRDPSFGCTLVLHANVSKDYHKRMGVVSLQEKCDVLQEKGTSQNVNVKYQENEREQWYVFNDFAISPVQDVDALTFNLDWKVPCILVYVRQDIENYHDNEVQMRLDPGVLIAESLAQKQQSRFTRSFTPLNTSESLKKGDVVGVDAEFVTLNQEESEMRRDGTLSTLRPSQMTVARITVVRGWGPLHGVPFIDDYISTSEQVVDYLTQFSGIKPGDLDASVSSKHLTTLKKSYKKLRYLIQQKVLFVGHGLKKDFRVINLVIPRDQVVDTVELFHIPKQRYVSLKFLAWHFLNIKIQADTHDSAEDAHTALKLYDKYIELMRAGDYIIEEELEILYETGRQYNWQVPD